MNRITNVEALIATYKRSLPELAARFLELEERAAESRRRVEMLIAALNLKADFPEPEAEATKRTPPGAGEYEAKALLVESGFLSEAEAEEGQGKGLITFIENKYKDQLSAGELKGIAARCLERQAAGKVKSKIPYLMNSIKNFIKEHGGLVYDKT